MNNPPKSSNPDHISLRDYLTGMALNGLCAGIAADYSKGADNNTLASRAVKIADAVITALAKDQQ